MINLYYTLFPEVTNKVYKNFIDTGYVPHPVLVNLAKKLVKKEYLNENELSIFYGKTSEINNIIRSFEK